MLRVARVEDAPAIAELEMELFPGECFNEYTIRRELEVGIGWVEDEPFSGYVLVRLDGELADITRLGVSEEFQGKGVGSRLLEKALTTAPKIMLSVRKYNLRALKLYLTRGFKITAEIGDSWVMLRKTELT